MHQLHRQQNDIRQRFRAFRLEMVLGHPQRAVPELVHEACLGFGLGKTGQQDVVGIAAIVDGRAGVTDVFHIDVADIGAIELGNHLVLVPPAGRTARAIPANVAWRGGIANTLEVLHASMKDS